MQNNPPSAIHYHSPLSQEPISREIKFLIACCQTTPTEEDTAFIFDYLSALNSSSQSDDPYPLSLSTVTTMASRHGVLPLVYKTLKNLQPVILNSLQDPDTGSEPGMTDSQRHSGLDPESSLNAKHLTLNALIAELKARYQSIAQRNMLMTAELLRIMNLLKENNIEALAFKGPALAQMAYGDITLRQYADLDILIRKEDIYKIDNLMKNKGYERILPLTEVQEKIWIKYAHDMGLIHKQKGVHFEMHWSFLDEDYPMQIDLETFLQETQTVKINGQEIPVFSNENLLYYLCIHGSKHLWERIEWIKDIDLMVRGQKIDWEKIIQKAEGSGFEKMLYLGLLLSHSLFRTPLPKTVLKQIDNHTELVELESFVLESWQEKKSTFAKTAAMLKLFPGIKEQILYLHKIILKPSFNEYWYVDLPKGLYWGYYLIRPYLLLKKYLTKTSS